MNRLQLELHRLYALQAAGSPDTRDGELCLIDASGHVRAMVLELARPADWESVSRVWKGVQVDLDLPAPAIAVSGTDGYQLWFSLLEPLPAPKALAFLETLRARYLGEVRTERVSLLPAPASPSTPSPLPQARHARLVPAPQEISGHWSAFVAPDLAPMFAEEPWLDLPPNDDGQSRLLARLKSILPADFQRALERLEADGRPRQSTPEPAASPADIPPAGLPNTRPAAHGEGLAPRDFLLGVMNDDTVALGLRIEAAKALLQGSGAAGPR